MGAFTHLHVHSEYSLLDGSAKIKEIISKTKELGMDSIALTDHGVMYGVIDFYKAALEEGIKPILGCEVYVASGSRFNKENSKDNFYYHLVLLAESDKGFHNLMKLVSRGFTEGFYYKPRVDIELLRRYREGLIALSACMSGPVAKSFLRSGYGKALEMAELYNGIFGSGNFFLELQDHGLKEQASLNAALIRMSEQTGIPLVCTNDSHYILRSDAKAHEILLCIQTGKTIHDDDRMRYEGDQFYIKSPEEMEELFSHVPEALENTRKIAERASIEIKFNEYKLPKFRLPQGVDSFSRLEELCLEGLGARYQGKSSQDLRERLEYELSVIKDMGFVDYFLITWDFIRHARENGIMVGPGRGSAAGSIVAYSLGITNIDPIKYGLIFERFLNPERISMPDIDIDFCYERRQEVIDYVIEKYGADHVTQIITFGTMAARAAIRDVGRALAMPYADVDRTAKMIPAELGITIAKALELNQDLKKAWASEADTKLLIDMSMRLEGLPRHASTHAAGVVICDKPVMEYVPLNVNDGVVTTQFPMTTIEELGLLKMDFLGLRTLTVIQNAVKEIKRGKEAEIDIDSINFEDENVFRLISQAKTEGVFQLESSGMKSFMRDLQPSSLEDIIAGISLYRPGPMDFIPKYVKGKNSPLSVEYTHPALKPILEATYGCIVYQEQVMQIVRDLGGYSLARSDMVRRAMSKKKVKVMEQERKNFINGCEMNGIPQVCAEKIFDEMTDFAKYAFNKSHAAAYAVIGYQTAWLKLYYPVEFMAATITSVMDFTAKVAEYIDECRKMGIKLLPPDVNESFAHFSVSGNSIRFGLLAIKNVGRNAIDSLVSERTENGKFTGIGDFINRLEGKDLNKRSMESFIKAGAFDSLGGKRVQYMIAYKGIMDGALLLKKKNIEGQLNLFDLDSSGFANKDDLPEATEYPLRELLNYEKQVLGIYVSGHPLSEYAPVLSKHVNAVSTDFMAVSGDDASKLHEGQDVKYGGIVSTKSVKYTKTKGEAMAFLAVEDLYGTVEVIVFPQLYAAHNQRLAEDSIIVVKGRVSSKEDEDAKITANDILYYEDLLQQEMDDATLCLRIPKGRSSLAAGVHDLLCLYKGAAPVLIYDEDSRQLRRMEKSGGVNLDSPLLNKLQRILGSDKAKVVLGLKKKDGISS
ncbi:MAG: DNA polymerase III subunit alpha [Clostridiales bacterium]|jgi:DNA polymerase-3 subunit alpha|nr:DNA polymerase III subunit alpha [Clostridiales bacterium]